MKKPLTTLVVLMFCLWPVGNSVGAPSHGNTGGKLTYPTGSAEVREDCTSASTSPCYETVQAAITAVEGVLPAGNRFVYIHPATYTEDVNCDCVASGCTGHTNLIGLGTEADASIAERGMPHIQGLSTGVEDTVHVSRCTLNGLYIEQGDDAGDIAVQVRDGEDITSVHIINTTLAHNTTDTLGAGEHVLAIEHDNGVFAMTNSRILCFCGFGSGCNASSSCIYIEAPEDGGCGPPCFTQSISFEKSSLGFGNIQAIADSANMEIVDSGRHVLVSDNVMYCETSAAVANSCFEIDDDNVNLAIYKTTLVGGIADPENLGRFMTVVGNNAGSAVVVDGVTGAENFTVDSVWEPDGTGVIPDYRGHCDKQIVINNTDIDDTAGGTRYYSLVSGTENAAEASVDDYITQSGMTLYSIEVEISTNPGGAESRAFTVVEDTNALTTTCTVAAGTTTCTLTDIDYVNDGSKVTLKMVNSNVAGGPAAATTMTANICAVNLPR